MFNRTLLIAGADGENYPGFTKAELTIGSEDVVLWFYYGYLIPLTGASQIGKLNPSLGYSQLCVDAINDSRVLATRPFIYLGKKYKDGDQAETIVTDWKAKVGQTVTVYLQNP